MPPFSGQSPRAIFRKTYTDKEDTGIGVNIALVDALDLSKVIEAACRQDTEIASAYLRRELRPFEAKMLARSKQHWQKTASNQEMLFNENAAEMFTDLLTHGRPANVKHH